MPLITAERFNHGETYAEVRERIVAEGGRNAYNLAYGEWAADHAQLDLRAFTGLTTPIKALVLSEEWCPDCTDTLPILERIARETGKLDLRILSRDANRDLADQFLWKGETNKIPTIIFLDADFNEIGHAIERPDSVTVARNERRKRLHAERPELGGYDATLRSVSDDIRDLRSRAETDLKRETAQFAVGEVVDWLSAALSGAPVEA